MPPEGPRSALAAVILAAGLGTRLRPLTDVLPKALCPVLDVPLVDWAIARAQAVAAAVAVNVHHGRASLEAHLAARVHLSVEAVAPLGTAGALGALRGWIDGRDVLVVNADAWHPQRLHAFVDGWDGERVRLLAVEEATEADFGRLRYTGAALLPWPVVAKLPARFAGLYDHCFAPAAAEQRLDLVRGARPFFDCGTPPAYLAANLAASGGATVVGRGAVVHGEAVRSVIWRGTTVPPGARLVEAVHARDDLTVAAMLTPTLRAALGDAGVRL